jgi:hypothetical protein
MPVVPQEPPRYGGNLRQERRHQEQADHDVQGQHALDAHHHGRHFDAKEQQQNGARGTGQARISRGRWVFLALS